MKLELSAKEVKSIGQSRVTPALDKKYTPWICLGVVLIFAGLFTLIAGSSIGGLFVILGVAALLYVFFLELWEAHIEGYKFLDSVIKGDTKKEQ